MSFSYRFVIFLFAALLSCTTGTALQCLKCQSWTSRSSGPALQCYTMESDEGIAKTTCSAKKGSPYCVTEIKLADGLITSIKRGCDSRPTADHSNLETCSTTFSKYVNTESTTCKIYCNEKDNCNMISPHTLKPCSTRCRYGGCDYLTGKCKCQNGYSGDDCSEEGGTDASSPENFRRCIQCNGATDINCKDKTTGSVCTDSANQYCSVSRTTTLSPDGQMLMESITRSCTPKYFAFDECFISREDYRNIPGSNFQYTCVRTCDTDNCNTGLPGKAIPNPSPTNRLQCMVCNANTCSSPSTYRDARTCPGKSTHCFSSVTYVITDKSYLPVNSTSPGNYYLQNVERKCVNSAVNAGCTTVSIGYGLSRVTCVETCQGNLCNIGWPARPRCSSCKARPGSSSDLCKNNPPLPRKCQYPYHEYCIMEETSYVFDKETSDQRQMSSISRGCSHLPLRNECVRTVQDGFTLMNCTKSCTSNSCNLGPLTFTGSSASLTQPFVKLYFWCVFINAIALTMSLEKCLS